MPDRPEIIAIGEGFRTRTFPGTDFHHREHLIMTVYLLKSYPRVDWRRDLPDMIRRYNESQGGVNSETAGYHDTITMFHLDLVERIVAAAPDASLEETCAVVLRSPASDPNLMLRFYSRDRLFSPEARRTWVEPDLAAPDFGALSAAAIA